VVWSCGEYAAYDRGWESGEVNLTMPNRVVALKEVVLSDSIGEMAEFDTWYVFGVDKIVN
jgi:hypothetical protein